MGEAQSAVERSSAALRIAEAEMSELKQQLIGASRASEAETSEFKKQLAAAQSAHGDAQQEADARLQTTMAEVSLKMEELRHEMTTSTARSVATEEEAAKSVEEARAKYEKRAARLRKQLEEREEYERKLRCLVEDEVSALKRCNLGLGAEVDDLHHRRRALEKTVGHKHMRAVSDGRLERKLLR